MHIDPNWFTSTSRTCFVGENLKSHVFPDLSIQNFGTFDVDFEGHVASSCMVCWFTFSPCVPWKENCTKPKKTHKCYNTPFLERLLLTNFLSAKFLWVYYNSKPTTKPWWTKNPHVIEKIRCRFSERHRGQIHEWHFSPPGWKLESTNQKNLTENWKPTFCWFVYKPNLKGHHYNLSSNRPAFFWRAFWTISF